MSATIERERFARIALSFVAEPGDLTLGGLLRTLSPAEMFAAICKGRPPEQAEQAGHGGSGLARAVERWAARLPGVPAESKLAGWERDGMRIVCPGDSEWPTQLDVLGDARPLVLWLRGSADLRFACLRSVSIVGARAATAYGKHVAAEMAAALAERGWAVISGGAFGIDASAHRGALGADGVTVAVLASGISYGYPKGHDQLFAAIAGQGCMVSEWPPDRGPTRPGFLVRNRVMPR
jgi:DNA processing protein